MARRRFNLKFFAIAGLSVVAVLGGGIFLLYLLFQNTPKQLTERGDQYVVQHNYPLAHVNYNAAYARDGKLVDVMVKDGDVLHKMGLEDPQFVGQDRSVWYKAVTADPMYLPAWQRLLQGNIEALRYAPQQPALFSQLHETAERIHQIKPDDIRADAYRHIATLSGWIHNIETPAEQVNSDIDALRALSLKATQDPDIPYYIARAYIHKGQEQARQGFEEAARKSFSDALDVMEHATSAAPEVADMHFNFFLVLLDAGPVAAVPTTSPTTQAAGAQHLVDRERAELEAARKYADKDDSYFIDIYRDSTLFELQHNDLAKAELIGYDLLKRVPNDQDARLVLANVLRQDPAKRDEAIALLRQPIGATTLTGWGVSNVRRNLEIKTNLELERFLLDAYRATADAQKRQDLLQQIKDVYQTFHDYEGIDYRVLKVRGQIEGLEGPAGVVKSIQTFEMAQNEAQQAGQQKDIELDLFLADAYGKSGQTGESKINLQRAIDIAPELLGPRIELVRLLLRDNDVDKAREQIDTLVRMAPRNAAVMQMLIQYYMRIHARQTDSAQSKTSRDKIDQLYSQLPETSAAEKFDKVQIALQLGNSDDAVRLLEAMRKETPGDLRVTQALTQIYLSTHKNDKAVAVLKDAIGKAPADSADRDQLELALAEVERAKPEEIERLTLKNIGHTADAAERELQLYQYYKEHGDAAQALTHLDAAEKANPDNIRVLEQRFDLALSQAQWDTAEKYGHRLGDKNADDAKGLIYLFRVAEARHDIDREIDLAHELTRTLPEFSKSWTYLGRALQAKAERDNDTASFEQAISDYGVALEKENGNEAAIRGIIDCYLSQGKADAARQYIKQGLEVDPNNPLYVEQLVQWELQYGDPHGAIAIRRAQCQSRPDLASNWVNLGNAILRTIQYDIDHGHNDVAQDEVKSIGQMANDALTHWPDEHVFYSMLARASSMLRDFTSGESALKIIAARDALKGGTEGAIMLAQYQMQFGKMKEAEQTLLDAREHSHDAPDVQLQLAAMYSAQGKLPEALKALDVKSADQRVQDQIVRLLIAGRKWADAEQIIERQLAALSAPRPAATQPAPGAVASTNPSRGSAAAPATSTASATAPSTSDVNGQMVDVMSPPQRASRYLSLMAIIDLNTGRGPAAVALLRKSLDLDPRNVQALQLVSEIDMQQVPPLLEDAINHLALARNVEPGNVPVRVLLAEAFRQKNDAEGAIHELEQTLRMAPGDKQVRMRLVQFYADSNPPRWLEAEHLLTEAESMPQFQHDSDWPRNEAIMWSRRGDPQKAMLKMQQALALSPNNVPLIQEYANILIRGKKFTDLLNLCNQILQIPQAQNFPWVYEFRAIASQNLDRHDDALTDYEKAFQLASASNDLAGSISITQSMADNIGLEATLSRIQPKVAAGDNRSRIISSLLYMRAKDFVKATSLIETVLAERSTLPAADLASTLEIAGRIYMEGGDYEKAKAIYNQILDKSPKDLAALNNMAMLIGDRMTPPKPDEGLSFSTKAMGVLKEQNISSPSVEDTHGWMLTLTGDIDQGISYLQSSLRAADVPESHYHLGVAYMKKQDFADAIVELTKAQKMIDALVNARKDYDSELQTKVDSSLVDAREQQAKTQAQATP